MHAQVLFDSKSQNTKHQAGWCWRVRLIKRIIPYHIVHECVEHLQFYEIINQIIFTQN